MAFNILKVSLLSLDSPFGISGNSGNREGHDITVPLGHSMHREMKHKIPSQIPEIILIVEKLFIKSWKAKFDPFFSNSHHFKPWKVWNLSLFTFFANVLPQYKSPKILVYIPERLKVTNQFETYFTLEASFNKL